MANEKPKYPFGTFGIALMNKAGEVTGENYVGNFEVKERLSMRDHLQKDSVRRSLLGDKSDSASPQAVVYAEALSHCSVSIVDSPAFWRESNGGLDLYDDNIVFEIYELIVDGQAKVAAATSKKGDEAKVELKKVLKKKEEKKEGGE